MKMALIIESTLFCDPQDGKPRENGRPFLPLAALSEGYRAAAIPLRQRLHQLRQMLEKAEDPEEIWHIKRRIAELTPMLTQMNELAELTAHYYDRGYWRSEKYTL